MSNDLWRWADPDGQERKVRLDELRAALAEGRIASNAPVWRSGWGRWQPAHDVPELHAAEGAPGALDIPPPPLAMVAVQQQYEKSSASLAPAPAPATDEPPPPPAYVPMQRGSLTPSPSLLKTQLGGSAFVPMGGAAGAIATPRPVAAGGASTPRAGAAGSMITTPRPGDVSTPRAGASGGMITTPRPGDASTPRPTTARLGPSMPTTIGVPPPPEVAALVQQAKGASQKPPPATPRSPGAPAAPNAANGIEELSDSMLVDSNSMSDIVAPAPNDMFANPPLNSVAGGERLDSAFGLPSRRGGLAQLREDLAAMRQGKPPKNKLLVGVAGVLAFSVLIMVVAGIVSLASGSKTSEANAKTGTGTKANAGAGAKGSGAANTGASATNTGAGTNAAASATNAGASAANAGASATAGAAAEAAGSEPALGDCRAAGETRTIAPRAVIASAIEAQAIGGGLALGFAVSPREAVATSLDPVTLTPSTTVRVKPTGDARRVTPMLVNGRLTALADVDRKSDHIATRRLVPIAAMIDVGFTDKGLAWAPHGREPVSTLFALEGEAPGEALRGIALPDKKGFAFTFRRGNAVHFGAAKGISSFESDGALATMSGLGQVGSPAIATSGDRIVVAWADRAGADDAWKVRWSRMKIGGAADAATTFALPEGGLGGQAMSPSLAGLGGGRFLLAWTEGPVSNHQVRAITINADGSTSGAPIAISAPGANAGQPAAIVGTDGQGAVAFLSAKGKQLEVQATPINCAREAR